MSTNANTRIPAVLTGRALTSLRDAGFDLPTALGEPTDNSLEAEANNVWLHLDESLDIARKTRLTGLPGKIHINDPLSVNESPNYQISEHSESHQIS